MANAVSAFRCGITRVVTLRVGGYGGIEEGIKKRLEGLSYTMSSQALLPDERLAQWVLQSAKSSNSNK